MFRTVPVSIIRSFSLYTQHTGLLAACEQDQDGTLFCPDPTRKLYNMLVYHCCVYSEKFLMTDRGTVQNMQEFYSKNKFEKLVHSSGFIISIYHDARSPGRHIHRSLELEICLPSYTVHKNEELPTPPT